MQRIRYGRIHRLPVRTGEPIMRPELSWTRTVKVLGENGPHPCIDAADYFLRHEVREFLQLLRDLGDGEIVNFEIRNGLPFSFEIEETLSV
jgi:hypothetical protein